MEYKVVVSAFVVLLVFVAYIPYFRDIFGKKTIPHTFTWLVWTLAVGVTCALQISGGAGVGACMTAVLAVVCFAIFVLSFWYGTKDISKLDIIFLVLALTSLALWIFAKQPILSTMLVVSTDVLGLAPTVRKSWHEPYSETLSMYQITTVRHALSILALQQYNILTLLYPIVWVLANGAFSIMLMIRRSQLSTNAGANDVMRG